MQKNYKTFITGIVWTTVVLFLIIHFVCRSYPDGNQWELETLAGDIGYCVAGVGVLAWFFNHLLWRIPFIGRWSHTPNLAGTWDGQGKSSFNNTEYTFTIKIKQTFLETHVHGFFEKSESHSFSGAFIHEDTTDQTIFVYSYRNDPKQEFRNKVERGENGGLCIHYGTTKLNIIFDNLTHLSGTYWNDRNCTGSWELAKKDKDNG